MKLDVYKHIYLIGVGGIGMSALARYFNNQGKLVFGYDKVRSDLCVELENEGIVINYNDKVSNVPELIKYCANSDILVIYTPAISNHNQILLYFLSKGLKVLKRAEVLGMISKNIFTVAVAGTHGKTTTSTMLGHILKKAGKSSTAFLGGISRNYNTNFLFSKKNDILIVEADEFDRSFLELYPDIAIITSVDIDHLDVYKDENDLKLAFIQFASQVKELLVIEKSISLNFKLNVNTKKVKYSTKSSAEFFAENIRIKNGKMVFDIKGLAENSDVDFEKKQVNIELQMPGEHNISNAIAASTVANYLGLSYSQIAEGLVTFKGIKRRYEKHIETEKMVFIDDYAHHPQEVSATIDTTKQLYPYRELIVVFQPHLYSRTKNFLTEFAISLQRADDLVLLDIYPAREKPIEGVDSKMLLDLCNNNRKELCKKEELLTVLKNKEIDILLTLGAGDIGSLAQPIKHMLN
ncbi:MAG: UDP-N-acetylmuramate--L-alanine ligase [Flavobacteriales bacterium]|nr:UDP-N-acetylmuramate--L-alanine ligase [Flavobacteriales bacterium]|tara:strand:- start:5162 stop:6556 length:1395 start_codon:yes stop_codon:yes gene_type:complete